MQGIGIGPPLEEFWDVSQGGLLKISLMSRKGVSEKFVLTPYEQLRVSECISNGTSSQNMFGFFHLECE